ncbi:Cytoplasmic tRNA 2-thiolation protein 2 [Parahypoxylon ruwenzoriense]
MTTAAAAAALGVPRPCNRCREHEATTDLRGAEKVCNSCFAHYVSSKAVKRLEALQRETNSGSGGGGGGGGSDYRSRRPQRYLVGVSRGPSSTALLRVLTENLRAQRARGGQKTPRFECVGVHVVDDTLKSPSPPAAAAEECDDDGLHAYRAQFPEAQLISVPLSSALSLPPSVVDWSVLIPALPQGQLGGTSTTSADRLRAMLSHLPSATSRADVRRLLMRHLLIAAAAARASDALLLGHSTTSLAELTLAETAKGRGFALPSLVNDGVVSVPPGLEFGPRSSSSSSNSNSNRNARNNPDNGPPPPIIPGARADGDESKAAATPTFLPIYSPLRELFRKELVTYLSHAPPPLTSLLSSSSSASTGARAVVSHKDLSIDDVLSRYFADVEASYPSVVANVVRTTGKLLRRPDDIGHDRNGSGTCRGQIRDHMCGLCGAELDEYGDERWRGEIGDRDRAGEAGLREEVVVVEEDGSRGKPKPRLCYGCERSIRG